MKTPENEKEHNKTSYSAAPPSPMSLRVLTLMPPDRPLKLLDIACGEGQDAVFFARCGYEVSAFDLNEASIEKTKKLAKKAGVGLNAFVADICDYQLDSPYDILFSSGALHYIRPERRKEIFKNYQTFTNENGLHAFNAYVAKPFIAPAPEKETKSYLWDSGRLLTIYRDWLIEGSAEYVMDCQVAGKPHKQAVNELFARKPAGVS
ncbi:MAG: methyltransferase domain-containing protein [Lachnospiraceae bacterium]|jgi:tellurite methyltransferase|nr:methyltransferase domain-containing protein [Lachnospiraceae bacterium]